LDDIPTIPMKNITLASKKSKKVTKDSDGSEEQEVAITPKKSKKPLKEADASDDDIALTMTKKKPKSKHVTTN